MFRARLIGFAVLVVALALPGAAWAQQPNFWDVTYFSNAHTAGAPDGRVRINNIPNVLPEPPNTEIWIALYVQVHQTDRASMRNIQLDVRRGFIQRRHEPRDLPRERNAEVAWNDDTVHALLSSLGLDERAPLSVLAIELLPEPNGGFRDPVRGDLGDVRILRTSPLAPVHQECC